MRKHPVPSKPAGLTRFLLRLPIRLYHARLGWLLGGRFVLIEHCGRRTGRPRETVVEVVARDRRSGAITVASGFGRRADWYQNLLAQPEATIHIGVHRYLVHAVKLSPAQAGEAMLAYATRHPFAARRLCRFMGFEVDGSDHDYRQVGAAVPFVRLRPDAARDVSWLPQQEHDTGEDRQAEK